MDNLTHSLFGLTLARTPLGRATRGTTATLVIASNIPDIDGLSAVGGTASYLQWHRGPAHGPIGVVLLSVASAGLVWGWQRFGVRGNQSRPSAASFGLLFAVALIGVLLHVLMDFPTTYGTRLLSPFDWHWFAVDWMPIIDGYLLVALGVGLAFGRVSDAAGRRNAAIVLVLMAANYGVRGVAHHRAVAMATRVFGPRLPAACDPASDPPSVVDSWPREDAKTVSDQPSKRCLVEIAAMPSFASPFKWRLIARLSNAYELQDIDLLDSRFSTDSDRLWRVTLRPNIWTPPAFQAAATPFGQVFLGFSRFPAARSIVDTSGSAIVRFNDVRFAGGLFNMNQPQRGPDPFTVTIQLGPDGTLRSEHVGR
ncbi:MAG TPA: metal-dependent hydrolase [Vicinamibacterales bacterium]